MNEPLTPEQTSDLMAVLKKRFEDAMDRHPRLKWDLILKKLEANPEKIKSLYEMEKTGGEPDVVGYDEQTSEYLFFDCSPESPGGRRNLCYDQQALEARKKNKPENSALRMADAMGVALLSEDQYRLLQTLGEFDTKTSSWIATPAPIRKRGGALFCDRRYNHVFVYHNGADSYYAVRGFRASLRV